MARGHSRRAWQPFTFGGVANFGHANPGRLILVCGVIALLSALAILNFVRVAWVPVLDAAIVAIPDGATIRNCYLYWPGSSQKLAANAFLSLAANPEGELLPSEPSDLRVEFTTAEIRARSSLGYTPFPYPRHWSANLAAGELGPLWGAWKPAFLLVVGVLGFVWVAFSWAALATLYFPIVRLIAFYSDRDLTLGGAWKLSCAALMPGALLMCFGIVLYSMREIAPLFLGLIMAAHLLVGVVYILFAPFWLPRAADAPPRSNPFGKSRPASRKTNPFA